MIHAVMKIVIVGAGMVGTHVARQLTEENKSVVLIEKNPEVARIATNDLDCLVVSDDGSHPDVLQNAGMADCEYFIALTGSDEVNIVTCGMVSGEFPHLKTIARVRNPYYSSLGASKRAFMGINFIINPEVEAANTIIRSIHEGVVSDLFTLQEDKLQMRTFRVAGGCAFVGKDLRGLRQELAREFLVPALVRGEELIIPSGEFLIKEADLLYFMGSPETLDSILGSFTRRRQQLRRICLIGGNLIAEYIIRGLLGEGAGSVKGFLSALLKPRERQITLMERSKDQAKHFAQLFPDITVLNRDAADEGALEQEQIGEFDLAVAVTDHQSLNLLTAMLAKFHGAKKAMALVINNNYLKLTERMEIDSIISLKTAVVNSILHIVRKANIRTVYSFYEDDIDLVELEIQADSKAAGKLVRDISMPRGSLMIYVIRGGSSMIPTGRTDLLPGDEIGIIVKKDAISKLETVFENIHEH
ncbi:MAG: Trk system potassium transporter TrkA [Spirochaetia bacterium]|jgi:trk system potassium uptake protein TrkA|nr:Trk system potassium transporter TrkA [Spirochaetia bacterium]